MVFFGFMVNYMLRVNLTIAIVDMVVPSNLTDKNGQEIIYSECVAAEPVVPSNKTIDDQLTTVSAPRVGMAQTRDPRYVFTWTVVGDKERCEGLDKGELVDIYRLSVDKKKLPVKTYNLLRQQNHQECEPSSTAEST
ncbi:hypothetical protein J6590_036235 [Homalodisca vitripennis]|nr:hypothetical protein J6590_036235 [Homalodisca vitripennis]